MTQNKFPCKILNWDSYFTNIKILAKKIIVSQYEPDVLVNIGPSGRVISLALNEYLHIKYLIELNINTKGISAQPIKKIRIKPNNKIDFSGKNVLIIDDITSEGRTITSASNFIFKQNTASLKTAVLYEKQESTFKPDYFGDLNYGEWIIFPWTYLEDIENLVSRIRNETNKISEIKEQLLTRYNLNLSEQEIKMFHTRTNDYLIESRFY